MESGTETNFYVELEPKSEQKQKSMGEEQEASGLYTDEETEGQRGFMTAYQKETK